MKRVTIVSTGLTRYPAINEINKKLDFEGWTVIRFWGEDIKKHTDECAKVVEETIFDNIEFEE